MAVNGVAAEVRKCAVVRDWKLKFFKDGLGLDVGFVRATSAKAFDGHMGKIGVPYSGKAT